MIRLRARALTFTAILVATACFVACGPAHRAGSGGDGGGGGGGGMGGDGGSSGPVCNDAACACTAAGGTWNGTTCTLEENPGGLGSGSQGPLMGGGSADGAFTFLYPYDQTVFPRGLLSPTLQFAGVAPSAVLVRITSPSVDYTGWFGASNPGRVSPSNAMWTAITMAATTAPLTVSVTKMSGSAVTGPITESWTIAQGSLRGIIYYETYGSPILGGLASVGIMKISPGATMPTPVVSGCGNVCHTASGDGSTLVAAGGLFGLNSVSYNLSGFTVRKTQSNESFVYGGLTRDGSLVMSSTNYRTWTDAPSKLYDSTSGANIPATGWDGTITNAAMPTFSPDGTKIAFNHEDTGSGHSLAIMNFDQASKSFSSLTDLATDSTNYLGWPAFTPDTTAVVYHAGNDSLFESDSSNTPGNVTSTGDLFTVDVASHTTHRLDALDGYSGSGTYLPASDPGLNFAPTMLPEAVGGYFWVVFTSHRSYGNTLPSLDNSDQNGKLWVAALDIGAPAGTDNSHRAFYLDGQESAADNLRGFWVLDPCENDGNGCTAGDQCCGGYCEQNGSGQDVCTSTPPACGNAYDECGNGTPCCNGLTCINDRCATVIQ